MLVTIRNKILKKNDIYEKCVACGKTTNIKITEHVDLRKYYIEGVGQLCDECGKKHLD